MKCNHAYYFIFALLILPFTGCASLQYSAEPIEAWVVDAETKQPLGGVVVTANWPYSEGTFGGRGSDLGQLMVMEAVTDSGGRFYFSGWGPLNVVRGDIPSEHPQLLLFKSGYAYRRLTNEFSSDIEVRFSPVWRSEWNGKTIELMPFSITLEKSRKAALYSEAHPLAVPVPCEELARRQTITLEKCQEARRQEEEWRAKNPPFPGTVEEEYAKHLESLNNALDHIISDGPEKCNWKKIPDTIRAMHEERKRLINLRVNKHLYTIDHRILSNDDYYTKKGCGSPKEYFQSLIP